jgi:hypothetical protein
MEQAKFYKMYLSYAEDGLMVHTQEWYSVHETPYYHFCVIKWDKHLSYEEAKERKLIKKVAKIGSRFAFSTPAMAMSHLKMLKGRQIMHLERTLMFLKVFLNTVVEIPQKEGVSYIKDTGALVRSFISFD